VRHGAAEVAGVDEHLVRVFSQRRQQIEAHLARSGRTGVRAGELAVLETRRAKQRAPPREQWEERARAAGWAPQDFRRLLGGVRHEPEALTVGLIDAATRTDSTLDRGGLLRAVAGAGALRVDSVEQLAGELLASDQVVPVGEQRWTTRDHLEMERRLLTGVAARMNTGYGVVGQAVVDAELACRPTLSAEQRTMIRRLLHTGHGVDAVVGHPGAGKTYALAACVAAWRTAGYQVTGTALSARAAAGLGQAAEIDTCTLATLLASPQTMRTGAMVVLVDEAGMVGTRQLDQLLQAADAAHAKIVLIGDHRQLPEIEAGGAFRAVATLVDAPELTENRRQVQTHEQQILRNLRNGHTRRALDHIRAHGNLIEASPSRRRGGP
jgi:hypothetical protein